MPLFCQVCQAPETETGFEGSGKCMTCRLTMKKDPRVSVGLPEGWSSPYKGLPDMSWDDDGPLERIWSAENENQRLEVRWRTPQCQYTCRVFLEKTETTPYEEKVFDYPHEVGAWLSTWFKTLQNTSD